MRMNTYMAMYWWGCERKRSKGFVETRRVWYVRSECAVTPKAKSRASRQYTHPSPESTHRTPTKPRAESNSQTYNKSTRIDSIYYLKRPRFRDLLCMFSQSFGTSSNVKLSGTFQKFWALLCMFSQSFGAVRLGKAKMHGLLHRNMHLITSSNSFYKRDVVR